MASLRNSYKVVLIGDAGVGKTTWVKRHLTGEFEKKYVPTLGVEVHPLMIATNKGNINFDVWDCAGQERFGGLQDGYFIGTDAFLIFYDVQSKLTVNNVKSWKKMINRHLRKENPQPVLICGNKVDIGIKYQHPETDSLLSPKSHRDFEKPLLALAKHFYGEDTVLTLLPAMVPPEVWGEPLSV